MNPLLERLDLILALNFPNDAEHDTAVLPPCRALRDRTARRAAPRCADPTVARSRLHGMNLRPDPVAAETWRRFAAGERAR
jgi:hypothetical protein